MDKIIFILPPDRNKQIGGYKVVYEYANRLSALGYDVNVGYDCRSVLSKYHLYPPLERVLKYVVSNFRRILNPRWFFLSSKVKKFCIYKDEHSFPSSNLIATAYETADLVSKQINCQKFYLIQGFEVWNGIKDEDLYESYRLGMKNIVVATWLKDIVDNACGDKNSIMIHNGLDRKEFFFTNPLERRKQQVALLYHDEPCKGSKYGIEVLLQLKKLYPNLSAIVFGVPKRPKELPQWVKYVQKANSSQLRDIYNTSQIYLYPAITDGFGLTCVESMVCGCALCSTNYCGVHEFAVDGENALLSPVKDVAAMVKNACCLLDDDKLRVRIAGKGIEIAEKFNWDKSVVEIERLFR